MNDESPTPPPPKRRFPWLRCLALVFVLVCVREGFKLAALVRKERDGANRAEAKAHVAQLSAALKAYATEYGNLPAGGNAQIMAALRGANLRRIVFFEALDRCYNARGELIDSWGTPYHIDVSNLDYPWVYSFGKDSKDDGGAPGSDDIVSWR